MFLLPIYAQHIPIEVYGLLALFEIFQRFLLGTAGLKIDQALSRWYWDKDYENKRKSLFFTTYLFYIISSSLSLVIIYLMITYYSPEIFGIELSRLLIYTFLFDCFTALLVYPPLHLMRVQHKAFKNTKLNTLRFILVVTFTTYFVAFKKMDLSGIFLARAIAALAVFLLSGRYIIKNIEFQFQKKILKSMLSYAWPLILSTVSTLILTLSDRFIIKHFSTISDVGNYSLSYKISNIILVVVVNSFYQAYVHIFFKSLYTFGNERFYKKILTYFVFVAVAAGLFLALFSKEILQLLTGSNENYWRSYEIIPVLTIGVIFAGMKRQMGLIFLKEKRTLLLSMITIVVGIFNISMNIVFVPILGNLGAAITTATSQFFLFLAYYIYAQKLAPQSFEIGKIFKIFAVYVLIFFLSAFTKGLNIYWGIVVKVILLASMPFMLYLWNFFEDIEIKRIKQSWKKWRNPCNWFKNISDITFK